MFIITCDKCGASIKLDDDLITQMRDDRISMIMGDADVFNNHPINITFGSCGGYGMLDIQCSCGNKIGGQE